MTERALSKAIPSLSFGILHANNGTVSGCANEDFPAVRVCKCDDLLFEIRMICSFSSRAELGKKTLRPINIIKICAALDMSPDYLLPGRISREDMSILLQKVSQLFPDQYRHLEDVVDSFIAVAVPKKDSTESSAGIVVSHPAIDSVLYFSSLSATYCWHKTCTVWILH